MLEEHLRSQNGYSTEGIFRIAPDKATCDKAKASINDGTFTGCRDVHVYANLIKVWFRDLSPRLLNCLEESTIVNAVDSKVGTPARRFDECNADT